MGPPDPAKENPGSWSDETGVDGIEALPKRLDRYGTAKKGAIDVCQYIEGNESIPSTVRRELLHALQICGEYLVFRHYFTVDKVRLHGASLCKKHLLCPLCAIRRGVKTLGAYLERWEAIRASKAHLRPFLVTLTVKDGPDLEERFRHLHKAQRELWKRKQRGRGSCLAGIEGAVWSYEVKRGTGSGQWHPHLHMIALATEQPCQAALSDEWHNITGDSHVVDVRPISQEDPVSGFIEVFKYAVKFSSQEPADTVHCYFALRGKRLIGSAGCFRGVDVPEELLDSVEDLDSLPFVTMFYRYLRGAGYSLERSPS